MKKVVIVMVLAMMAIGAKAQSVKLYRDTTQGFVYANIRPVLAKIGDEYTATQLVITTYADNQLDHTGIYWELRANTADGSTVVRRGNYSLDGDDYAAWGDKNYLYRFVSGKLGVVIE